MPDAEIVVDSVSLMDFEHQMLLFCPPCLLNASCEKVLNNYFANQSIIQFCTCLLCLAVQTLNAAVAVYVIYMFYFKRNYVLSTCVHTVCNNSAFNSSLYSVFPQTINKVIRVVILFCVNLKAVIQYLLLLPSTVMKRDYLYVLYHILIRTCCFPGCGYANSIRVCCLPRGFPCSTGKYDLLLQLIILFANLVSKFRGRECCSFSSVWRDFWGGAK